MPRLYRTFRKPHTSHRDQSLLRLSSGTGLSHLAILSRANAGENSFSFPLRLIADDGDATPHPNFSSEAFRFVRILLHSLACLPDSISFARTPRFSQDVSARASPVPLTTGYVFLQSSAKIFPEPIVNAGRVSHRTAVHRQARLNSRNRLIISIRLHIVNHSSTHRRK